jgi:hypothetical protein
MIFVLYDRTTRYTDLRYYRIMVLLMYGHAYFLSYEFT